MRSDIWTWLQLTDEGLDDADLGLIAEARRLAEEIKGRVTVVAAGPDAEGLLPRLSAYGADGVIHLRSMLPAVDLGQYQGELFVRIIAPLLIQSRPAAMLLAQRSPTADLAARLGAALEQPVITRAVDIHIAKDGAFEAKRPIANGYLFETVSTAAPQAAATETEGERTALVTMLPDVLPEPRPVAQAPLEVHRITPDVDPQSLTARSREVIEADPETLALEEADIVVAAGRGAGKDEAFAVIHRLAHALGGSVGGTRPVIDDHLLPFERQIGQTGKSVTPRLIVNCGISGANEYTAGIEKSQLVIAVNTDLRARIFRFADLGIVGDLHDVLPLLAQRLEEMKGETQ